MENFYSIIASQFTLDQFESKLFNFWLNKSLKHWPNSKKITLSRFFLFNFGPSVHFASYFVDRKPSPQLSALTSSDVMVRKWNSYSLWCFSCIKIPREIHAAVKLVAPNFTALKEVFTFVQIFFPPKVIWWIPSAAELLVVACLWLLGKSFWANFQLKIDLEQAQERRVLLLLCSSLQEVLHGL